MIEDILKFNHSFVENKAYEPYMTSKFPDKKLAIVTCMDTRLTELLPKALGLKNGDAKIIKNAGGVINHPYGSVVRSLLIAIYELGVRDIMIIGHTDCGVQKMDANKIMDTMKEQGVDIHQASPQKYGVDLTSWLQGFDDVEKAVQESITLLKTHPLIAKDVHIFGFIMDSNTGALTQIK